MERLQFGDSGQHCDEPRPEPKVRSRPVRLPLSNVEKAQRQMPNLIETPSIGGKHCKVHLRWNSEHVGGILWGRFDQEEHVMPKTHGDRRFAAHLCFADSHKLLPAVACGANETQSFLIHQAQGVFGNQPSFRRNVSVYSGLSV
ncbi:hypothetical protein PGQ11_001819 [Apiospora arundinis]|uniref:Uncharacterized protein n=1 Tax=Apiospora arundinis TaxID=335852 RepID=A0ABR2JGZ6_9PEZI